MNRYPVLYIGIAAPLLEEAHVWRATVPMGGPFPRSKIGAYQFAPAGSGELEFRTGRHVRRKRVQQEIEERGGELMNPRPDSYLAPIPPLDHKQSLAALKRELQNAPVEIEARIGLTLQQLQRDLSRLRPELVLLH